MKTLIMAILGLGLTFSPCAVILADAPPGHHQSSRGAAENQPAQAADSIELIKLLIPLAPGGPVHGQAGTLWYTDLWARNNAEREILVNQIPDVPCSIDCLPGLYLPPHSEFEINVTGFAPVHAGFLYVEKSGYESIAIEGRIREVSRDPLNVGTELPIVRAEDTASHTISLLKIWLGPRYRQTLRVYEWSLEGPSDVAVRFFAARANTPRVEFVARLHPPYRHELSQFLTVPGFVQIDAFATRFPELGGLEEIRIEVEPLTEGSRIWAFVSITDQVTQQFVTVTPQ